MREIPLTRGIVALVDDDDYDMLTAMGKWCANESGHTFYAIRGIAKPTGGRTTVAMHTVITGWSYVDHINGTGWDNRRANLRPATKATNARNACLRSDNKSGFRGVSYRRDSRTWLAQIVADGQYHSLGRYLTREEAARAYDDAARELHGEFATLNFPGLAS